MANIDSLQVTSVNDWNEEENSIATMSDNDTQEDPPLSECNEEDNSVPTTYGIDPEEETALIRSDEGNARQNEDVGRPAGIVEWCNDVAKVIYILLFVPRLFSLIVFFGYDIKCAVNERTTFVNCTQEFLVPHPKHWVTCWKAISIASSFIFIFIVWCNREQLNYNFHGSLKQLCKKASFWLMNVLFVATMLYYVIRVDGSNTAMSVMLLLWWPATLLVVYFFNYLPPVCFPSPNDRNPHALCFFLGYWLTIIVYCAETLSMVLVVTLAAKLKVATLLDRKDLTNIMEAYVLMSLWIRIVFTTGLLGFFFKKLFHGKDDLF